MNKIYHTDSNGFLIGESFADLDPLEKKPLIPAGAVTLAPPLPVAGKARRFVAGAWELVEDNSGVWYMADGSQKTNTSPLEVAGDTRTAPPSAQSAFVAGVWVADSAKVKTAQNAPVLEQIAALEAQVTARVWREYITKPNTPIKNGKTPAQFIADIDAQIATLRATLQA